MLTRRQIPLMLATLGAIALAGPAWSQAWPQKHVKIIVPFAPGGNTDGIARVIGQRLSETLGQQFVIENKPGANGAIAAEFVAHAPADGYTLFLAATPQIATLPALTKTPYDPVKDFDPVSNVGTNPFVLTVNPDFPSKTLKDFVERIRAEPNKIPYASGGSGSLGHLTMALFLKRAGLEMTHVPYRGGGPAIADALAGHIPVYFANLSEALPHAASGKLRLLAVSSAKRSAQIPDVPTVSESGYPGFQTLTWNGILAPAGTPKDIVNRLAREVALAVKEPAIAQKLANLGVDPLGDRPEQFAATIAADIALWAETIKIAGVTFQ
jgi:tripartite-type tricarboxylate transporter receptor subunit TctC